MSIHTFPCDCTSHCSIAAVVEFDGDDAPDIWIEFYEQIAAQRGIRRRVSVAWQVLCGRDPWTHCVSLNPESLEALRDRLSLILSEADA